MQQHWCQPLPFGLEQPIYRGFWRFLPVDEPVVAPHGASGSGSDPRAG